MKKWQKGLVASAVAAGAYIGAVSPARSTNKNISDEIFFAHRGFHDNNTEAPENTLPAFAAAVEHHYGIELDVQVTKDGRVVVAHDLDLNRIAGIDRTIDSYTYDELKKIHVCSSSQHIPLFSDVLKLVDGKVPLIVELKYKNRKARLCEKTQKLLDSYHGEYCIESFLPQVLLWYRKNRPDIVRGQLSMNFSREEKKFGPHYFTMHHLLPNFLTRPDFIAYDWHGRNGIALTLCRKVYHCQTYAWTIKNQTELNRCRGHFDHFIFEGFEPYLAH